MTLLRQRMPSQQRQVSETTNQLIQKNSEMLKISTIETARENERGIIDLETLQKTQQDLIETLEETILIIQQEGRQKRRNRIRIDANGTRTPAKTYSFLSQKRNEVKEEMRAVNDRNLYLLFLNKDWREKIFSVQVVVCNVSIR